MVVCKFIQVDDICNTETCLDKNNKKAHKGYFFGTRCLSLEEKIGAYKCLCQTYNNRAQSKQILEHICC